MRGLGFRRGSLVRRFGLESNLVEDSRRGRVERGFLASAMESAECRRKICYVRE